MEKFGPSISFDSLLPQFSEAGVSVNTFYMAQGCKKNFEDIASGTNGECKHLVLSSSTGLENTLKTFVTEKILESVGRINGLDDELILLYRKK